MRSASRWKVWGIRIAIAAVVSVSCGQAFAEAEDQPTLETESFQSNIIGSVDVRPSWTTKSGEFHIENYLELGAQVTRDTLVTYYQAIYTNLYQPSGDPDLAGMHPTLPYGFFRARFNNLWVDKANGLSFGYEPRVFLPTTPANRDQGMIGVMRNYIRLTKDFGGRFSVQFIEMPVFHAYSRTGYLSGGAPVANPAFENRIYAIGIVKLTREFTFMMPVMFHQTKYQNFQAGAANNGMWSHFAWVYPELAYAYSPNTTLGVAFYSDNLVQTNFSGTDVSNGFEKGILQFSVATSL